MDFIGFDLGKVSSQVCSMTEDRQRQVRTQLAVMVRTENNLAAVECRIGKTVLLIVPIAFYR